MIAIADSHSFRKLISALSNDVVLAHVHWRLHVDLIAALKAQPVVWAQSHTFWHLTITAHATTAVEHLCRAFDQEQSSLHLLSWLQTIRANLNLFRVEEFKKRMAHSAFVESLASTLTPPDPALLDEDIAECSTTDPLVRRLVAHRGSAVAHRSVRRTLKGSPISPSLALGPGDIDALLARARIVFNRYCQLFSAETYSVEMIGHDDYEFIFKSVSAAVATSRATRAR